MIARCGRAALIVLAAALAPRVALAQDRFHVLVGSTTGVTGTLVEFQPCVPAEGSDCGGRIERRIDVGRDADSPRSPEVVSRVVLWDGGDSLRIDRGPRASSSRDRNANR